MKWIIPALLCLTVWSGSAAAENSAMAINDLIERAKELDGQTVTVEGEVIGDVMVRGDHGWVNISDGTNDIGVWAPADMLASIRYTGRYHTRGDTVRVTGTFYRADPQHGGDLDLRADQLEIIAPGAQVVHPAATGRIPLAAASLLVATVLGLWLRSRSQPTD